MEDTYKQERIKGRSVQPRFQHETGEQREGERNHCTVSSYTQ